MFYYYYYIPLSILLISSSIKSCPLNTVDSRSGCYCGIEIDGTNYIQCQPYSIEKIPEFTRSYVHDKLNLSYNFIRNLTSHSFDQLKVRKIYLQQNLIESIDKQSFNNNILNYLEELHLDMLNNGSLEFLCYGTWNKLRVLELTGFNLNQYDHCLTKLHRLDKLIIQNSRIDRFSSAFYTLPHLHELSLINNQIEYLTFDTDLSTSSSNIKIFNLTSNQLRTLPNDLFHRMPQLHTLDLSHNLFENLPMIQTTHHHFNLNLSYNLINSIQLNDQDNSYDLSFNPICTLEKSVLQSNVLFRQITRLHCDCRLAFFLRENLLNKSTTIASNPSFDNETRCFTPLTLHGLFLKDVTYEQLLVTCTDDLPSNCREVNHFQTIENYTEDILGTTTISSTMRTVTEKLINSLDMSSFRLTSFYTKYENNNLIIYWDFDRTFTSEQLSSIEFQIILEQESSVNTQIIRRSGLISVHLKQYIIHHIPSNKHYYVCLLLTRSSYGTDKYCRETRTFLSTTTTTTTTTISNLILSKQAIVHMLFTNRSIVFGFLFGTILTAGLLLTLAFVCHLRSKRQRCRRAASSLLHHPHQQQQHYLYVDRNDDDGTYSNSVFSSSSSAKYHHFKKTPHRTCFPSLPTDQSWYRRNLIPYPTATPAPPCCFHHHRHVQHHTPDTTMSSSSTTARRITTLSSQYSNAMEKEPMTSTSIMSSASSDEQTNHSPAKHVYEELADETTMLKRNHAADVLL